MSQLLESIRIENGKVRLIEWHNARAERSILDLHGILRKLDFRKAIHLNADQTNGIFKCRIIYDQTGICEVVIAPYTERKIQKIRLVEGGNIAYAYKELLRPDLDRLFRQREDSDEICIVDQRGFVTDAYYFNFVFEVGGSLFTPKNYLLPGVMKSYLEFKSKITPTAIHWTDIQKFEKIHLINALNPLGKITLKTSQMEVGEGV